MTTPKSTSSGVFYARIANKKRNKSAIDIEKDLTLMNDQDSGENIRPEYEHPNNPSTTPALKQNDPYKIMMANMNKDNLSYISDLLKVNQLKETRAAQRKSNHARTKSSLGQYSSVGQNNQSNLIPEQNAVTPGNQMDSRETKTAQKSIENQQSISPTSPQSFFEAPFKSTQNKCDESTDNFASELQHRQHIQQKSHSHRSLNETLPIFSKANQQVLQGTTPQNSLGIQSIPQNNLSFQVESDNRIPQAGVLFKQTTQQQDIPTAIQETNQSTGLSVRRTEQAHFLQFLGNYVTYLSQTDENPSQFSTSMLSNPIKYSNQQQQQQQNVFTPTNTYKQNQLMNENHILQKELEQLQKFNQLISIQQEDKQKIAQQSEYIEKQALLIEDLQFRLNHTQNQLGKERIEHENEQIALKKLISAMQQKFMNAHENILQQTASSAIKQNSRNSFSLNQFHQLAGKNDYNSESANFEVYEQTSPFFSSQNAYNSAIPIIQQNQLRSKNPNKHSQKIFAQGMHPFSKNDHQINGSSNFVSQDNSMMFDSELHSLNNTGIFNYQGHHIIDEEENTSKPSDNISNGSFVPVTERLNQEKHFDQFQPDITSSRLEYSGILAQRKPSFISYKAHVMQQQKQQQLQQQQQLQAQQQQNIRGKKYSPAQLRNSPSVDRPESSQSFYQPFLSNPLMNDTGKPMNIKDRNASVGISNKQPLNFLQNLQDQGIYQQQQQQYSHHIQQQSMQAPIKSNKSSVNVSVNNSSISSKTNNYNNSVLLDLYPEELNTSQRHPNGLSLNHLE